MNLSYETLRGHLKLIASGASGGSLDSIGISQEDWKLVTGDKPWMGADRARVVRTLTALVHGAVDAVGVERFDLPAEWIAGVIAVFVAPGNVMSASRMMSGVLATTESMAQGETVMDEVTPSQLFSLIGQAYSDDLGSFKAKFNSACEQKIEHATTKAKK